MTLQNQHTYCRFGDPGGAEYVGEGVWLAAARCRQALLHDLRLHLIVKRRGGAVQVDIAHRPGGDGIVKRLGNGADGAFALRMRGRNMVRIA